TDDDRVRLADLAAATGAAWTLGDELRRLGVPIPAPVDGTEPPELREWLILTDGGFRSDDVWMSRLASAPWLQRPRVLWRALWPSTRDLRIAHPQIPAGAHRAVMARLARIGRGLVAAPHALAR